MKIRKPKKREASISKLEKEYPEIEVEMAVKIYGSGVRVAIRKKVEDIDNGFGELWQEVKGQIEEQLPEVMSMIKLMER